MLGRVLLARLIGRALAFRCMRSAVVRAGKDGASGAQGASLAAQGSGTDTGAEERHVDGLMFGQMGRGDRCSKMQLH